ncbi:MAG: radical SAM protein [Candidatus Eremiobacterota bacterium]
MKILFIENIQHITHISRHIISTGLLSLATVLKQKGYDVEILSFTYLFTQKIIDYSPDQMKKLEIMCDFIINKKPDIVGFTTMCNSFHNSLLLAELIKKRDDKIKIILGGPQTSVFPERILKEFAFIDLICYGEGENKIEAIIKGIEHNDLTSVPGIVYRENNLIRRNEDNGMVRNLDELPELDYDLIPYFSELIKISIHTGRGCPYKCVFCSTSNFWQRKYRTKSIEGICKEIETVKKKLKKDDLFFEFTNDNICVDYNFFTGLCKALKEINIDWMCYVRLDSLDEELIKHMSDSGCKIVFIGMETGSPSMQKYTGKNLNLERVDYVIDNLLKYKIRPIISFISGFPDETEEDLALTLNMFYKLLKKGVYRCDLHSACVLSGTKLYDDCKERLVLKDIYSNISDSVNFPVAHSFVKENKDLFPHLYTIEGSLTDKYPFLEKFCSFLICGLYRLFPDTIDLFLKAFNNDMLLFYKDFIASSNRFAAFFSGGEHMKDFVEEIHIHNNTIKCLGEYTDKKRGGDFIFDIVYRTFLQERKAFVGRFIK